MKRPDYQERRAAERAANMAALCAPSRALRRGTYAGTTTAAAPKTLPYRDPALLEIARGRPCLLLVPGVCSHRIDTVVACHSNLGIHGKAGARKADDCYSVWGCHACHAWLDSGKTGGASKEMAFMEAHLRQVLAWRQIAADPGEPERFRRAAGRALKHLNATPTETNMPETTATLEPGSAAARAVNWLRRHPELTRVDTATLCAAISVGRGHVLERVKPALDAGLLHYASAGAGHKAWWSLVPLAAEEVEIGEHQAEESDWERRTSAPEIQPRPGPWLPGVNVSVYGATGAA